MRLEVLLTLLIGLTVCSLSNGFLVDPAKGLRKLFKLDRDSNESGGINLFKPLLFKDLFADKKEARRDRILDKKVDRLDKLDVISDKIKDFFEDKDNVKDLKDILSKKKCDNDKSASEEIDYKYPKKRPTTRRPKKPVPPPCPPTYPKCENEEEEDDDSEPEESYERPARRRKYQPRPVPPPSYSEPNSCEDNYKICYFT